MNLHFHSEKLDRILYGSHSVVNSSTPIHHPMPFIELFVFGSWLFYVLLFVLFCFAAANEDGDHNGKMFFASLVFLACFHSSFFGLFTALTFLGVLKYVGGYIAVGILWSIFKWMATVRKVRNEIKDDPQPSDYNKANWRRRVDPSGNKGKITTWGIYWPFSMIWTVIHDAVDHIWQAMLSTFRRISAGAIADLDKLDRPKADQ
jgi:hypothetical protein